MPLCGSHSSLHMVRLGSTDLCVPTPFCAADGGFFSGSTSTLVDIWAALMAAHHWFPNSGQLLSWIAILPVVTWCSSIYEDFRNILVRSLPAHASPVNLISKDTHRCTVSVRAIAQQSQLPLEHCLSPDQRPASLVSYTLLLVANQHESLRSLRLPLSIASRGLCFMTCVMLESVTEVLQGRTCSFVTCKALATANPCE